MEVICHQCGTQFEKVDKKIRHTTPNDGLRPYQRRTKKIEILLGDKLSTAKSRLNKLLMFELVKKCSMERCPTVPTWKGGSKIYVYMVAR